MRKTDYNREYYLKNKEKIQKRRSTVYSIDTEAKNAKREYNKNYYTPSSEKYPRKTEKGTLLDEDTLETETGIYYRTIYFARKIGCSDEFLRRYLRKHSINKRAIRYYCVKYYPDDLFDILLDLLKEDGYRVRRHA